MTGENLHLDTHVVVWLYGEERGRIPVPLRHRLAVASLRYSPTVRMELGYLHAKGRVTDTPEQIVGSLAKSINLREEPDSNHASFSRIIDEACGGAISDWDNRDPFDRLIVAHARAADALLVTKDQSMHDRWPGGFAVWDS